MGRSSLFMVDFPLPCSIVGGYVSILLSGLAPLTLRLVYICIVNGPCVDDILAMLSYQMLHPSYRRTNICTARTSPVLVVASFLFSNVQMVSADASIPKYMDKDGPCPPMHVCWSILDQSQMLADD